MIISRTPFRISFFGGGTDFPDWYNKYSGKVISTTIDKYSYISLRKLPPFFKISLPFFVNTASTVIDELSKYPIYFLLLSIL